MGLQITRSTNILQLNFESQKHQLQMVTQPHVLNLRMSPSVTVPWAQQDFYGIVKGSDSVLISDGVIQVDPVYLTAFITDYATRQWVLEANFATISYVDDSITTAIEPLATREWVEDNYTPHVEKDIITGLSGRTVHVLFSQEFDDTPVGWVNVYRMQRTPDGSYRETGVLWGYLSATKVSTTGFSVLISSEETTLTGIVIEYEFK
jgi:hypothetical protein